MAENQNKEKDLEQPVEEQEETTEAAAEEKETSETPEAEEKESAEEVPEKKSKFFKKDKKDKIVWFARWQNLIIIENVLTRRRNRIMKSVLLISF